MQVNGLSGVGSKTAGIKMAQKMDSFSINIKNEKAERAAGNFCGQIIECRRKNEKTSGNTKTNQ